MRAGAETRSRCSFAGIGVDTLDCGGRECSAVPEAIKHHATPETRHATSDTHATEPLVRLSSVHHVTHRRCGVCVRITLYISSKFLAGSGLLSRTYSKVATNRQKTANNTGWRTGPRGRRGTHTQTTEPGGPGDAGAEPGEPFAVPRAGRNPTRMRHEARLPTGPGKANRRAAHTELHGTQATCHDHKRGLRVHVPRRRRGREYPSEAGHCVRLISQRLAHQHRSLGPRARSRSRPSYLRVTIPIPRPSALRPHPISRLRVAAASQCHGFANAQSRCRLSISNLRT